MIDKENKIIDVWWPKYPLPGNFGDVLTPWLIKKITNYDVRYVGRPFKRNVLLGVGSIINFANEFTTVWGSGIQSLKTKPSPMAKYLAVRGPLTYDLLKSHNIECKPVFGDPALLLPKFYNPKIKKKYSIGIVPHYVDYDNVSGWYNETDINVINVLNSDITKVIYSILECEHIITSSLHGFIIANAYGIPASWVKFSNKIIGDNSKFLDHLATMNTKHFYTEMFEKIDKQHLAKLKFVVPPAIDVQPLLNSFPLH